MYTNNEKVKTSAKAIATLRWNKHSNHRDLLVEFYHFNKYYLTEQMKDAISDAIECLDFADKAQAMLTNEPIVSYSVEVKNAAIKGDAAVKVEAEWSYRDDCGNPVSCHCTNCGCRAHTETGNAGCQTITEDILSNFCPNCGARMLKGGDTNG